jgi:hypothetical protein
MFLVKTGDLEVESLKVKIWSKYYAPEILYYLKIGMYLQLKYRLRSSELRIEFYLDPLHNLCRSGNNFLGVYTGSKYLVAVN